MILTRKVDGHLYMSNLDLEIFMGDLFEKCDTDDEVEWLKEQIDSVSDLCSYEREEEFK